MQTSGKAITEIIEGNTKILVPNDAITEKIPPRVPAFFNPRAKLNRDFSIIIYSTFWKNFDGPKIFLDGLSGVGARSLRVAKEIPYEKKVIANDANSKALELASKSALLNNITNFEISENEVCRFFSLHSKKNLRASIVDIDPFGSPSKYIDCGIRATMHGGLFSTTATDLQVLHGLFVNACKRRYYGIPIKTEYGNEIAIRLILGCISMVAARLDIEVIPQFVDNAMHYYRTYVKILNRPPKEDNIGYILHCKKCGNRGFSKIKQDLCEICSSKFEIAGPLWVGKLFGKKIVENMLIECKKHSVDKKCEKILEKCVLEYEMPGTYFTLDEIASKMKVAPLGLKLAISKLEEKGFLASPTSLNPTGFRTNCKIDKIIEIFAN